ncbi:MAG: UDP-N-acetylmuramate dehydrogenase [Candidatus Omnitrophica bacterium]|nr:UDP-N-acetylmuramate dehydrogenase [Candidatus Omnitrophota bacterium]
MNWPRKLKAKICIAEPLKDKTTFKIGGLAQFFVSPKDLNDLKLLVSISKKEKIPVHVIGSGSNLLVSDGLIKSIVIKLDSPFFKKIHFSGNHVELGSGVLLNQAILASLNKGLSGFEFFTGIPGTLGGALAMNAGAWGKNIGDLVENVRVMDYNGKIRLLKKENIIFGYRSSSLAEYIILDSLIKLSKTTKKEISRKLLEFRRQRSITQDASRPNAGCIFRNPANDSAGRLIDACGLKGRMVGGACVSKKHANFILNQKNATANDVLGLMEIINSRVKRKFNINLKPEIKIWR